MVSPRVLCLFFPTLGLRKFYHSLWFVLDNVWQIKSDIFLTLHSWIVLVPLFIELCSSINGINSYMNSESLVFEFLSIQCIQTHIQNVILINDVTDYYFLLFIKIRYGELTTSICAGKDGYIWNCSSHHDPMSHRFFCLYLIISYINSIGNIKLLF